MWSISQTTAFEAAHRLMRNLSKCSNIHGHNYKIETIISYYELDKKDMIIDFYVVKNILDNIIENPYNIQFEFIQTNLGLCE